jgi:hypothetical protein
MALEAYWEENLKELFPGAEPDVEIDMDDVLSAKAEERAPLLDKGLSAAPNRADVLSPHIFLH